MKGWTTVILAYYVFALLIVGLTVYIIIGLHQSYWWLLLLVLLDMTPKLSKTDKE